MVTRRGLITLVAGLLCSTLAAAPEPIRETRLEIVVRPTEIDGNDHANNARYLEWLQWGRDDWYTQKGLTRDLFKRWGVTPVTVNINIDFKRECLQGEALTIASKIDRMGDKSYAFFQSVRKANGETAAEAVTTLVVMDTATRKSRAIPDEMLKVLAPAAEKVQP
ncbi:MAG TPA: acyl-CoA thioesterase [Nitrospira sp.]|nr:acyl-CoA thioesterase [Nitrospira sp.]